MYFLQQLCVCPLLLMFGKREPPAPHDGKNPPYNILKDKKAKSKRVTGSNESRRNGSSSSVVRVLGRFVKKKKKEATATTMAVSKDAYKKKTSQKTMKKSLDVRMKICFVALYPLFSTSSRYVWMYVSTSFLTKVSLHFLFWGREKCITNVKGQNQVPPSISAYPPNKHK